MRRLRFLFYPAMLAVILIGLLIFFNTSKPVLFLHEQIFNALSIMLTPLNTMRLWSNGIPASQSDDIDIQEKLALAQITIQQLTADNNRLRSIINFKERNKLNLASAAILAHKHEMGREFILIDLGAEAGITKGSLVVNANGLLIGIVERVENNFSKVEIAANTEYVFDATLLPLNINIFAKGIGNRTFLLDLLPQHAMPRTGDFVVARINGISFLMAEVIHVETNSKGAFKEAHAVLLSRPENEKEVFIVRPTAR